MLLCMCVCNVRLPITRDSKKDASSKYAKYISIEFLLGLPESCRPVPDETQQAHSAETSDACRDKCVTLAETAGEVFVGMNPTVGREVRDSHLSSMC